MRSFCLTVLISTTFLCLPEAVLAASVPTQAQYIYGSVKSIPADATGALDLTDAKDLQFQYGSDGYKLPYGKIKSYEFTESKGETRTIGGVPLPKLPFLGRQETPESELLWRARGHQHDELPRDRQKPVHDRVGLIAES